MTMQKRDFLLMLKRLQIVDPLHLTASRIISVLAEDDATIRLSDSKNSGSIRLDIEVTWNSSSQRLKRMTINSNLDVFSGIF